MNSFSFTGLEDEDAQNDEQAWHVEWNLCL